MPDLNSRLLWATLVEKYALIKTNKTTYTTKTPPQFDGKLSSAIAPEKYGIIITLKK